MPDVADRFASLLGSSRGRAGQRERDADEALLAQAHRLVPRTVVAANGKTVPSRMPELSEHPAFEPVLNSPLVHHDVNEATRVHIGLLIEDGAAQFAVLRMHRPDGRGFDEPQTVGYLYVGHALDEAVAAAQAAVAETGPAVVGQIGTSTPLDADAFRSSFYGSLAA